ncbi:hypothetical protein A2U01_0095761, partial [Trifolium medium]|nr:hypothetical protein [Trifolium medium]
MGNQRNRRMRSKEDTEDAGAVVVVSASSQHYE